MAEYEAVLDQEQARELLDTAADRTVLVVGDAMLDRYILGSVERISPEAPVPVLRVESESSALGGAANVAAGIVALGARCRLVGTLGQDGAGDELGDLLVAAGVDATHMLRDPDRPTTQKTRLIARHQQVLRVDRETVAPPGRTLAAELRDRALAALEGADVLVFEDYDKGVLSPDLPAFLLEEAARRGIPSVVDPKLRHFFDFRGASVFKPNVRELAAALGLEQAPREEAAIRSVLDRLGCANLLLTLGEEGMLLVSRDRPGVCRIPSLAREVFDVTGAGDTVVATLAVALVGRPEIAAAASLANHAAGIEVSRLGAVPVTRQELLEDIARRS